MSYLRQMILYRSYNHMKIKNRTSDNQTLSSLPRLWKPIKPIHNPDGWSTALPELRDSCRNRTIFDVVASSIQFLSKRDTQELCPHLPGLPG